MRDDLRIGRGFLQSRDQSLGPTHKGTVVEGTAGRVKNGQRQNWGAEAPGITESIRAIPIQPTSPY